MNGDSPTSYHSGIADSGCFQQCFADDKNNSKVPLNKINRQNVDDTRQEMKNTEDFLASELSKLSVQERSKALDDLHCVGDDLEDTPEMIENLLLEMDQVLQHKNAPIYNIAASQNRAYVEDPNFRIRFLRANYHDVEKAANQLINFLSQKEI